MRALPRSARTLAVCTALALVATACNDDGREMREPTPDQTLSIISTTIDPATAAGDGTDSSAGGGGAEGMGHDDVVTVPGFDVTLPWADGDTIPDRYTCDGEGLSPAVGWDGLPAGTVEVAVVARNGDGVVRWVLAGIAPGPSPVVEGAPPAGAIVGMNSAGALGWDPPCPAAGANELLRIEVRAIGQQLEVQSGDPADAMVAAIEAATMASAVATGIAVG